MANLTKKYRVSLTPEARAELLAITRQMSASVAKVALAALSGGSPRQIASRFGVHPAQVAMWKKRLVEGAEEFFADQRRKRPDGAGGGLVI